MTLLGAPDGAKSGAAAQLGLARSTLPQIAPAKASLPAFFRSGAGRKSALESIQQPADASSQASGTVGRLAPAPAL